MKVLIGLIIYGNHVMRSLNLKPTWQNFLRMSEQIKTINVEKKRFGYINFVEENIMREWENADIKFDVCLKNIEDSNLFLRKFYEELSKHGKIGWSFQSYREDTVIRVGDTNYGEMWIEYKQKGKICKIYFQTSSKEVHNRVEAALKSAKEKHDVMKHYTVTVSFIDEDIKFCDMCRNGIEITSTERENKILTRVTFPVKAFGQYDLQYVVTQKINYLQHLLCAYTNIIFSLDKISCDEGIYNIRDNVWQEPNQNWITTDDQFINIDKQILSLSSDFFSVFRKVVDKSEYNREIRLLLNASQEIFCSKKMISNFFKAGSEWNIPGYTDLINTLIISALEPLSNIFGVKSEKCSVCGSLKYSVRKKVRDLCNAYFPEQLAKEIYDKGYHNRSAFLHEGYPVTNEFYCGHCVPLINPVDGRSVLFPGAYIDLNLFEYVTFIFRKTTSDVLKEFND